MKIKEMILILSFFVAVTIFSNAVHAAIVCDYCDITSCTCTITGCPKNSGIFNVYESFTCSGVPIMKGSFSGGAKTLYPKNGGTFYVNALCSDRTTIVPCTSVRVGGEVTTTTTGAITKTTTTTKKPTPPPTADYTWVIALIIIIVIGVVVYFLFLKKPTKKATSYESLYRKWGRR